MSQMSPNDAGQIWKSANLKNDQKNLILTPNWVLEWRNLVGIEGDTQGEGLALLIKTVQDPEFTCSAESSGRLPDAASQFCIVGSPLVGMLYTPELNAAMRRL